MKKITLLVGDWPDNFVNNIKFFEYLQKKFNCNVEMKNEFLFETNINKCQIQFQFCFGPLKDNIWIERQEIRKKEGRNLPPSIEEISKLKFNCDELYYLGFCGVLNGEINRFYLPESFKEILFKEYIITEKSKDNFDLKKSIKFNNKLIGKIDGINCHGITSNQVLSLRYVENSSSDILKELGELVSKQADIVEMENYEIIKRFGNKNFNGIFLYGGDSPLRKEHMSGSGTKKMNMSDFVEGGLKLVQLITK